jgi:hypothetical protein
MKTTLESLSIDELVSLYAAIPRELKTRGVIRSNNFLGDLGEFLAIRLYNDTKGLPKLQAAPPGTQNVDALSRNGERYSIKSTRGNVTGVFYGLGDPNDEKPDPQKFEYVIVVQFFDDCSVQRILEISWDNFLKHKKWHSRMRAWNLSVSKSLIADSKVVSENKTGPAPD